MQIIPYLSFEGNATEAIELYKKALGAKDMGIMHYGDNPGTKEQYPEYAEKVLHAELKVGDGLMYISDTMPEGKIDIGTNMAININFDSDEALNLAFDTLAVDGDVLTPLNDTFWGARYGMVNDRFGNGWSLNYQYPEKK
ncbi:MAG: glyoxalase/bleomycin resistance/extradiol dioxygenase family protein [Vallitaleaceae bacterium]|jgi:PhnB protein|nr:glyoxalase/bleomycin resistance/extradiol dioxygenase family protein [Vallitaleaceae bacterium]